MLVTPYILRRCGCIARGNPGRRLISLNGRLQGRSLSSEDHASKPSGDDEEDSLWDNAEEIDFNDAFLDAIDGTEKKMRKQAQHKRGATKFKFVDKVRLDLKGGEGGDGCVSFFQIAPGRKRADGGPGGRGGSIHLVADKNLVSLNMNRYNFAAESGKNGSGQDKKGKAGQDLIIKVPCGTVVKRVHFEDEPLPEEDFQEWHAEEVSKSNDLVGINKEDLETLRREEMMQAFWDKMEKVSLTNKVESAEVIGDLDHDGATILGARGGEGGVGNRSIASKARRHLVDELEVTRKGELGEEVTLELELKTIADVGLVGFPNAGKSTFLASVSRAKPKIAAYPFTTLHPYVGVVDFPDGFRFSVADIPGIIEGAHMNLGLGHGFLRHIERTKVLLYIVDTSGSDGRLPWDDFHQLQSELELYSPGITTSPSLVIANKMDLPASQKNLSKLRSACKIPVVPLSAMHHIDINIAVERLRRMIEKS